MKRCTYCGQECPDDVTQCPVDQHPLAPAETHDLQDPEPGLDFLPRLLALKMREKDNGLCLLWKCPRCLEMMEFNAVISHGNFSILGVELTRPATLIDLRCAACKFELRVPPDERDTLEKIREATRRLIAGELSPEAYHTLVRETPAQFVKDLEALTRTWKCPACGEENPVTFDTCWNCTSGHNSVADATDPDAKPFPTIPKGGNAWE